MMNQVELSRTKTWRPRIIVFEDHEDHLSCICKILRDEGMIVDVASDIEEFKSNLQRNTYDASSVDWNVNDVYLGPVALRQLAANDPQAGKVVFSVLASDPKIKREAIAGGADFVLEKPPTEDYDEYLATIENAAQLGLSRRIAKCLADMGRWPKEKSSPQFWKFPVEASIESELRAAIPNAIIETIGTSEEGDIMELAKHRGWLQVFDHDYYAELPEARKLRELILYVGTSTEDVAKILNVTPDVVESLLEGDELSHPDHEQIEEHADKLLSILAYVLRLSTYQPELMSYYWTAKNLFPDSLSKPPWDHVSLANYLRCNQIAGVNDALLWIRSH